MIKNSSFDIPPLPFNNDYGQKDDLFSRMEK